MQFIIKTYTRIWESYMWKINNRIALLTNSEFFCSILTLFLGANDMHIRPPSMQSNHFFGYNNNASVTIVMENMYVHTAKTTCLFFRYNVSIFEWLMILPLAISFKSNT